MSTSSNKNIIGFMMRAGSGVSELKSFEEAAVEGAAKALEKGGFSKAGALLIFASSIEMNPWPRVFKKLRALTGTARIVGSSAYGILTEQAEIEQRPGVAVLALEGAKDSFSPFRLSNLQESSYLAGVSLASMMNESEIGPSTSVIFPDAFSFQHGAFFDGLESEVGVSASLIGGCSSEQDGEQKTLQWVGEQISPDSVAGIAFGKNWEFEVGITQSCQPLGEPLRITRSQGNVIYEIDGRPAYDIFLELITQLHFDDSREVFHRLFLGLPITSFQTEFSRARYLVRNITGVNAKKGVVACASHVEQGDYMTFALRDPMRAKQDLVVMLEDMKNRADGRRPVFGLYFNCCARGLALYNTSGEDTALIREYFPQLPLAGFFTFGEIAPVESVNHLHHYSGVLALAFEKS